MFTLTHLDQLATAPVSESIKSFLHNQLITQPFGTLEADQTGFLKYVFERIGVREDRGQSNNSDELRGSERIGEDRGQSNNSDELVALLSVTPKLNLFVAPNGRWLGGYIPAEFRGYPFRQIPEQSSGQHVLCFDKDSGQLSEQPQADGEAFFDAEGKLSPSMQKVMNFLKQCEHSRQLTQNAVDALARHGLITPWSIKLNASEAETNEVKGLFRIDEAALRNLNGDALKALSDANALSLAYAQLLSQHRLQALSKLYDLHARAKAAQTALSETDVEELFGAQDDTLKFNF